MTVKRKPRRDATWDPGPDCAVCGYKAINVRHQQDPHNAPEGFEYYRSFLHELHEFKPVTS